jgi:archaellum biogenesis ATPase FlaH
MNSSTDQLIKLLEKSKASKKDISTEKILKYRTSSNDFEKNRVTKSKEEKSTSSSLDDIEEVLSKESRFYYEFNKKVLNSVSTNILIDCDASNNHDLMRAIIKKAIQEKKVPILVLTSTNYKSMISFLKDSKIDLDKLYLIDTVSKNLIAVENFNKVFFIDSLRNLTQLQILIIKILEEEKRAILIFDSIDVLEFYHNEKVILKFVYSVSKLIQKKSAQFICIINGDKLGPKLAQFFNDFVQIKKIE